MRIGLDQDSCLHILSGDVPWSLVDVAALCDAFGKEPGFFFDQHHAPISTSAISVPSAEGGESTVWCPPSGIGTKKLPSNAQLRHVTRLVPKLGIDTVGMYIFFLSEITASDLKAGCQYILSFEDGLEVVSFESATSEAAVFRGSCEPKIHRITLPDREAQIGLIVGEVVGLSIIY